MTEPKKTRSSKAPFTLDVARAEALAKVTRVGAKGGSPITAATKEPKRSLYEQALQQLEAEGAVYVDRDKAKPKYFLPAYALTAATVAAKAEQWMARQHPKLATVADLKKTLSAREKALGAEALELLVSEKRAVKFTGGKSVFYAHGDSLRVILGVNPRGGDSIATDTAAAGSTPADSAPGASGEAIRGAYRDLVRLTGFPDVRIAALQRNSGATMAALKDWLLEEHQNGRAVFGVGDWSLANEETRAGVIDLRGDRYLLVRLED